jgi:hypothetical protein
MARYDHLPIYRAAFDLAVHIEKTVRHFSRYHKYSLGTELREGSRGLLARIVEANTSRERGPVLDQLGQELEQFSVLVRLCHAAGACASTRAYLHVAEQLLGITKQNTGWRRHTATGHSHRASQQRSGTPG